MHKSIMAAALVLATAAAPPEDQLPEVDQEEARPVPPIERATEDGLEILPLAELADQRGGATFIVNNQTLLGIVQGNVIDGDYVAGTVAFSDSALSNFNGILSLAINTGLQSNIISGMAVTINVQD